MELRYCEKCGDIIKLEGKDERINPAEHFVCPRCEGGGEGVQTGEDSFEGILDQATLNLFSPSTLAMKRSDLIKEAPKAAAEGPVDLSKPPTVRAGSSFPARTARKLQFRCLHCRSTLMIRPVEKPSRMVCPKCKGSLFIDQTGIVSKRSPTSGTEPAGPTTTAQPASARVATGAPAPKAGTAAAAPRPAAPPAPTARPVQPPAHPPAASPLPAKAGPGSVKIVKASPEAKAGGVRRMPSSIQRTFPTSGGPSPAATEPKKTSLIRTADDPFAEAVLDSTPGGDPMARQPKSVAKPRKEPSIEPAARQEDLFRGLSISTRPSRPSESAARKTGQSAPGAGSLKDFEELEAELAQVEDFTKPLPEASSPTEKIAHSPRRSYAPSPEPVGFLRRVAVLVLVPFLTLAAAAPFYLAGHLSTAGGAPSDSPLAAGSQRAAFERLGKVVERGKAAILSLPARKDPRAAKAAPTEEGPAPETR